MGFLPNQEQAIVSFTRFANAERIELLPFKGPTSVSLVASSKC